MNSTSENIDKSVSVIIAAYNAQDTIARAISSALSDMCVSEVIIVDDASTDNTVDAAKKSDDGSRRVKIFVQEKNMGPSAARNRAIEESSSTWVTTLDSDDFLIDARIEKLLGFANGYDLIADDMYQVAEDNTEGKRETLLQPSLTETKEISFITFVGSNITKNKRTRDELGFIKPLIRRSTLVDNNISYQERMRLGEDYEIYARLLAKGAKMILVPAQGYVSVRRENSLSGTHSIEDLLNLRECNLKLIKDLSLSAAEKKVLKEHYISIDCRYQWRRLIDAVKKKNILAAVSTFIRPYPVPFYLLKQLAEQFYIRVLK